jgi:hypothetical protein
VSREPVSTWRSKVLGSVLILLGTAVAARVVWELLRPLLGVLVTMLVLLFIYWQVFARRR